MFSLLPSPSYPSALRPQLYTNPEILNISVWLSPQATYFAQSEKFGIY